MFKFFPHLMPFLRKIAVSSTPYILRMLEWLSRACKVVLQSTFKAVDTFDVRLMPLLSLTFVPMFLSPTHKAVLNETM